jgi:tetratricopeptide (TPR) repeat protein
MEVPLMKKRIAAIGVFLLLVFAVSVFTAPAAEEKKMSKKATKLMTKALEAIQAKQPDQAIDLLNQVLALEPGNAMVHHNLGVLNFEKGKVDEAIANFEEALRLKNDYPQPLLALRQTLYEAGKNASGQKEYEKANAYLLKLDGMPRPEGENKSLLASAQYIIGFNFFNLKQYDKASEYFGKCQANEGLEKENLDLYANANYFLGMTNHIQGQYGISGEHFKKYLSLYAGSETRPAFFVHATFFIGANLFRQLEAKLAKGDVDKMTEAAQEMLPYLKTAVENKIPSEDAYVMLGNCHVFLKEYDLAVQTYQQLIELFPQSGQLKSYQAFLPELLKMQQQAQKTKKKR